MFPEVLDFGCWWWWWWWKIEIEFSFYPCYYKTGKILLAFFPKFWRWSMPTIFFEKIWKESPIFSIIDPISLLYMILIESYRSIDRFIRSRVFFSSSQVFFLLFSTWYFDMKKFYDNKINLYVFVSETIQKKTHSGYIFIIESAARFVDSVVPIYPPNLNNNSKKQHKVYCLDSREHLLCSWPFQIDQN